MAPTAEEAAQALQEIDSIARRSLQLRSYRYAAPHLILWGVFWVIGYCVTDFAPRGANQVWESLAVLWVLFYLFYSRRRPSLSAAYSTTGASVRSAEEVRVQQRYRLRFFGLYAVFGFLIFGTALIMRPRGREMGAYIPLLVASIYLGAGLWGGGSRYIIIGMTLAALTLCGYLLLPQYFLLLMAFAGGGALILTGLWFRKA